MPWIAIGASLAMIGMVALLLWLLLRNEKKSGKQEVENENLQKVSTIQKKQNDIANSPADDTNGVFDWLRIESDDK